MKILYFALILVCSSLSAQTIDTTFNNAPNQNSQEHVGWRSVPLQSGKFLTIYGIDYDGNSKIVRLTQNGTIDNTYTPILYTASDLFDPIRIFIRSDDSFIVASQTSLRSYNASGQVTANFVNTSFEPTATIGETINDLVFQTDGKMILSGQFTVVNGVAKKGLVRLNTDGNIDPTFNPSGSGLSGIANQAVIQENGKIVVCGDFHSYNGVAKHHLIRLNADGTIDSTFDVPYIDGPWGGFQKGIKDPILGIAVQADGKIIPVGAEMYENYTVFYNIVRLNANGSRDIKFENTNTLNLKDIKVKSDGSIWTKGDSGYIVKYDSNGIRDTSFLESTLINDGSTYGNFYFSGDKVMVNCDYWDTSGITRKSVFRLNADGTIDKTFNPGYGFNKVFHEWAEGLYQNVIVSKILKDGKILVSGNFSSYNDVGCPSLIRLTRDGNIDPTFVVDPSLTAANSHQDMIDDSRKIKQQPDGKILIFDLYHTNLVTNSYSLIRLNENGSIDLPFCLAASNFSIWMLSDDFQVQNDGKIILKRGQNLTRLNNDGTLDTTFNAAVAGTAYNSVEVLNDGKILVTIAPNTNDSQITYVKRLNADGSVDTTFPMFFCSNLSNTKVQPDGKILIFYTSGRKQISRLNADGTLDATFNTISTNLLPLNVFENGQILLLSPVLPGGITYTNNGQDTYADYDGAAVILNRDGTFSHSFINTKGYFGMQDCDNLVFWSENMNIDNSGKDYMVRYNINDIIGASPPDGPLHFTFTPGQTLSDIHVEGQNIQWYASQSSCMMENSKTAVLSSPLVLDPNTLLVNGTTYYAAQIVNQVESLYRLPVTVESALGTNNPDAAYFKTFPNPVYDIFHVAAKETIEQIEVYNVLGMLLDSKKYASNNLQIDFSNRNKGIYLVKLRSANQSQTIKVIKN